MKELIVILILLISFNSNSQETRSVLFLGNSLTYYNDLPGLLSQAASSTGDVLEYQSNLIPNASYSTHVNDGASIAKIQQGNWDYVVLQGIGSSLAWDEEYIEENVYPSVDILNGLIEEYNACGETMFFMTWGLRDGVPSLCSVWPPFCSYETMDDLLRENYLIMAADFEANTAPVGAVWRFIRENYPSIDLYNPDGGHPSLAGSYAGAITFYTSIFGKDPNLVTFNSTLSATDADNIKNAVRQVVYFNLSDWFIGEYEPSSSFSFANNGNLEYVFTNNSDFSNVFLWDFGDNTYSTEENPVHIYDTEGVYEVSLNVNYFCSNFSISTQTVSVSLGLDDFTLEKNIKVYPNPSINTVNLFFPSEISEEVTLEIFTYMGAKVLNATIVIENQKATVDISTLSSGCYFLKFIQNNEVLKTSKLIKK